MALILALDLGSTQLKLLLLDENARVVYVGTQGYPTQTPCAGRLEQRPADWLSALARGMDELRARHGIQDIAAVSFSGHMSGVVLLDADGQVLRPCIMLSDTRSTEECAALQQRAGALIRLRTGNPVVNAFSLPKLLWLQRREPECWRRVAVWLSPKDYLRFCLTGQYATDYTDAYNSLCIAPDTADWCGEIIASAGLEVEKFPPVLPPHALAGTVTAQAARLYGLREGTPVYAGGADMACGAVGMGLYEQGDSALTLGTCATFLAPVRCADEACFGQVTFHLHATPGLLYALGSHFNGGLAVNWLTRILSEQEALDFSMMDTLSAAARQVPPGSGGVLTLPFLAGSESPYFDAGDRQTVLGASTATTRAELFRSQLEGITLNLAQTQHVFDRLVEGGLRRVLLGGGGSKISVWPQIIADVFGTRIDLVSNTDASAVGAAILGGVGAGIFPDAPTAARRGLTVRRTLTGDAQAHSTYQALAQRYAQAYALARAYYANAPH